MNIFSKRSYVKSLEKNLGIVDHKIFYGSGYIKRLEKLSENIIKGSVKFFKIPKTDEEISRIIDKIGDENRNRDLIYSKIVDNDFDIDYSILSKCGHNFRLSVEYLIDLVNSTDDATFWISRDTPFINYYLMSNIREIISHMESKALPEYYENLEDKTPNPDQWTNYI